MEKLMEIGSTNSEYSSNGNKKIEIERSVTTRRYKMGKIMKKRNRTCLVCGDRSIGCNFGAATCESCKSFFRRHVNKTFHCKFDGKCQIDMKTRMQCYKCKLEKCFRMGMRKDLLGVRQRARTKKFKRRQPVQVGKIGDVGSDNNTKFENSEAVSTMSDNNQLVITVMIKDIENMRTLPSDIKSNSNTRTEIEDTDHLVISQTQFGPVPVSPDESLVETGKVTFQTSNTFGCQLPLVRLDNEMDQETVNHGPLALLQPISNWKHERLQELLIRHEETWNEPTDVVQIVKGTCAMDMTMEDFCLVYRHFMHKLAKQYTRLSSYKELPMVDQMSLIKERLGPVAMLRESHKFDPKTGLVETGYPGLSHVNMDVLKAFSNRFYTGALKLKLYFPDQFRQNDIMMVIICSIGLFTSDKVNLIRPDLVVKAKNLYLDILKHYLESIMSEREAHSMYRYLNIWLNLVRLFGENVGSDLQLFHFDPIKLQMVKTRSFPRNLV